MVVFIILVALALMAFFVAVAIAGNRAHDRQDAQLAKSRAALKAQAEANEFGDAADGSETGR